MNTNLEELTLLVSAHFSTTGISLPNLKYLILKGTTCEDDMCIQLVMQASQLIYLSLDSTNATADGVLATARFCLQLRFF